MIRKSVLTVAIGALALAVGASSALAAKKHRGTTHAAAAQAAETIPGVNPMTNAPASPAVTNPGPVTKMPGVNPM